MSVTARFKLNEPNDLQATLTASMTVGEWLKVKEALSKQGRYGPEGVLFTAIEKVVADAEKVFYDHKSGEGE